MLYLLWVDLPKAPVIHPEEKVSLIYFYQGAIPMRNMFYMEYNYVCFQPPWKNSLKAPKSVRNPLSPCTYYRTDGKVRALNPCHPAVCISCLFSRSCSIPPAWLITYGGETAVSPLSDGEPHEWKSVCFPSIGPDWGTPDDALQILTLLSWPSLEA